MKRQSVAIPGNGVYIRTSTDRIDLAGAKQRGQECIESLRKILPDIPNKCKYKRGREYSSYWYLTFDLGVSIKTLADNYFHDNYDQDGHIDEIVYSYDENIPREEWKDAVDMRNKIYWGYIKDIQNRCNNICKEFSDEDYECSFSYVNNYRRSGFFHDNAILTVFDKNISSRR